MGVFLGRSGVAGCPSGFELSFAASLMRRSAWLTDRFPRKDRFRRISPYLPSGWSSEAETSAAATARSLLFADPTASYIGYTSRPTRIRRNAPQERQAPWQDDRVPPYDCPAWCTEGRRATSACISTKTGRVPSIPAKTAAPATSSRRSARNRADGFPPASCRHRHLEDADLVVGPNRFLIARNRRNWDRVRLEVKNGIDHVFENSGPRDMPSLVTCPTRISVKPRRLARRSTCQPCLPAKPSRWIQGCRDTWSGWNR